jgi:cytochrome c biogenesis protein ResB
VLLAVLKPNSHPVGGWLLRNVDSPISRRWTLKFLSANARNWTGLQVKRDPGTAVVWAGFALVLVGCWMAFFWPHRRLWVRLHRDRAKTVCQLAASSNRGQPGLEEKVEGLTRAWEKKIGLRAVTRGNGDEQ